MHELLGMVEELTQANVLLYWLSLMNELIGMVDELLQYNALLLLMNEWIDRYGGRATTGQCALAIIVMSLQSIVGVVIQVIFSIFHVRVT